MNRRGTRATIGAAVLIMTALIVAAQSQPVKILSRPESSETATPRSAPPSSLTPTLTTPTPAGGQPVRTFIDLSLLYAVMTQVVIALLAVGLLFGLAVLVQALIRRRPRLVAPGATAFTVPPVPEELLDSAESRMALLEAGEPRNAIVAAWLDLEAHASASGLPRHPSETSTEYATRVISTWRVDRERLADLAQLYREARFSLHPLGEAAREQAIADLTVLHEDLARAAAEDAEREESSS